MKQFNLDEYLANPNREIVTRDGRKVIKVLCTDAKGPNPVVALIERYDKVMDNAFQYTKDGKYFNNGTDEKDLFFAPEKKEGWINLYKNANGTNWLCPQPFTSKEEAEKAGKTYTCSVTTIKIEWEE